MSGPAPAGQPAGFNSEMGFTHQIDEGVGRGRGWHAPELSVPGTTVPHASVMLTSSDTVLGLLSSFAISPRIALTVDLRSQVLDAPPFGPIEMEGHLLKIGRTTTFGRASFSVPGADSPFAVCVGTFIGSPRPDDVHAADAVRAHSVGPDESAEVTTVTMAQPFGDRLGICMIDTGVAEVDHRPDLLNGVGSIQGGVLAFVAETAAQSLATAEAGRICVVDDLDIRYLRAARVGPARAHARVLHRAGSRVVVEVETRDRGSDDRVVSYASARCTALDALDG